MDCAEQSKKRLPERFLLIAGGTVVILLALGGCLMQWMYGDIPNRLVMDPHIYALNGSNSRYDDFNAVAAPPSLTMDALIVFSSNARTHGERFSMETGRFELVQNPYSQSKDKRPPPARIEAQRTGPFPLIPPASGNLRGPTPLVSSTIAERDYASPPFSHYMTLELTQDKMPLAWDKAGVLENGAVWMFDSDQTGHRNLYFVDDAGTVRPFFGNDPQSDDAYATYDFERHELYFSSNRSGRFQLYRYRNHSRNTRFSEWLGNPALASVIESAEEFFADADSMAPFVEGNLLVFASNRSGTHGGFDLYASIYSDNRWSSPQNMQDLMPKGVALNTPANEFRPSLLTMRLKNYHELRVLLFSSDRPGGQGGYDLYVTALPQSGE